MKHGLLAALAVAGGLAIGGCASGSNQEADVCTEVQAIESDAATAALLDGEPSTSAIGVVWADVKSACSNGSLNPTVSESWAEEVLQDLLALAPSLVGLI
jgi:hypothetical protein